MQKTIDVKCCGDLARERCARIAAILAEGICTLSRKRGLAGEGRDTRPQGEIGRDSREIGRLRASEGLDSLPHESGNGQEPHK